MEGRTVGPFVVRGRCGRAAPAPEAAAQQPGRPPAVRPLRRGLRRDQPDVVLDPGTPARRRTSRRRTRPRPLYRRAASRVEPPPCSRARSWLRPPPTHHPPVARTVVVVLGRRSRQRQRRDHRRRSSDRGDPPSFSRRARTSAPSAANADSARGEGFNGDRRLRNVAEGLTRARLSVGWAARQTSRSQRASSTPSPQTADELDASFDVTELTVAFNPDYLASGVEPATTQSSPMDVGLRDRRRRPWCVLLFCCRRDGP
jgi:hypothetical protein